MNTVNREETLIGRIAAGEAGEREWSAFVDHATQESGAWERLACTLRDEMQIRAALDEALDDADHVEIEEKALRPQPIGRIGAWPGWAVAAMLALAWVGFSIVMPTSNPGMNEAGVGARFAGFSDPDEAYQEYLRVGEQKGRVVEELPMVMIETRALEDGEGYEVLYVRQLLERARVDTAFQISRDETGRPQPVQVNLANLRGGTAY